MIGTQSFFKFFERVLCENFKVTKFMAELFKLIKYHLLVDTLTDEDFNQFMAYLVKTCGRDAMKNSENIYHRSQQLTEQFFFFLPLSLVSCLTNLKKPAYQLHLVAIINHKCSLQ